MLRLTPLLTSLFATTSLALTFTSPFAGSTVDLTSSLKVTWIPGPSDPSTFTLEIINTDPSSAASTQILASNIQTTSGSYVVPANTIDSYGNDFELSATSSSGEPMGSTGAFSLAEGVYTLQTASNGVLTLVSSSTQLESPPSSTGAGSTKPASSASSTASSKSGKPSSSMSSTATASPRTSSSVAVTSATESQSQMQTQSSSASSTSSRSGAATSSSSGSDTNSNLGFDGAAANIARGSVFVSCGAALGALALLV